MATYTKESLLQIVDSYTGDNADWLEVIEQIKQILQPFDKQTELGKLKSVDTFIARNGFSVSRLDPPNVITENLTQIYEQIQDWTKKCLENYKESAVEAMNKSSKFFLNIFLVVVGFFAIAAVVLTVMQLGFREDFADGWIGKLAGACGTLDFALGALGFIVERKDDLSKKTTCANIDKAIKSGDTSKAISISIKAGAKSTIVVGDGNVIAKKVVYVNNYLQK